MRPVRGDKENKTIPPLLLSLCFLFLFSKGWLTTEKQSTWQWAFLSSLTSLCWFTLSGFRAPSTAGFLPFAATKVIKRSGINYFLLGLNNGETKLHWVRLITYRTCSATFKQTKKKSNSWFETFKSPLRKSNTAHGKQYSCVLVSWSSSWSLCCDVWIKWNPDPIHVSRLL